MLMSFVGAVGVMMGGSGLEETLKITIARVPKLPSGKKFPQNAKALHFVVGLLRPVLVHQEFHTIMQPSEYQDAKSQHSSTTKLWVDSLIKPIFIMMTFVQAKRDSDWPLHLFDVEKNDPTLFHIRSCQLYPLWAVLSSLCNVLIPKFLERLMSGEHPMPHQDDTWNAIWSDLFTETTYRHCSKGPSGIIRSTLNESTLAIWALSNSSCAQLLHKPGRHKRWQSATLCRQLSN